MAQEVFTNYTEKLDSCWICLAPQWMHKTPDCDTPWRCLSCKDCGSRGTHNRFSPFCKRVQNDILGEARVSIEMEQDGAGTGEYVEPDLPEDTAPETSHSPEYVPQETLHELGDTPSDDGRSEHNEGSGGKWTNMEMAGNRPRHPPLPDDDYEENGETLGQVREAGSRYLYEVDERIEPDLPWHHILRELALKWSEAEQLDRPPPNWGRSSISLIKFIVFRTRREVRDAL